MKKHLCPSRIAMALILGAFVLAFFVPFASRVQAQLDGYYSTGEPCREGDIGSDVCDYDDRGQPVQAIPTGQIYTGPGGNGVKIIDIVANEPGCPQTPSNLKDVLCKATGIVNTLLPLVAGATLIVFFWGLISVIRNSADAKAVEAGRKLMIWGIVGLFVMVSVWGILNIFLGDFFGTTVGVPQLPA